MLLEASQLSQQSFRRWAYVGGATMVIDHIAASGIAVEGNARLGRTAPSHR
jgi:hypothetical protein